MSEDFDPVRDMPEGVAAACMVRQDGGVFLMGSMGPDVMIGALRAALEALEDNVHVDDMPPAPDLDAVQEDVREIYEALLAVPIAVEGTSREEAQLRRAAMMADYIHARRQLSVAPPMDELTASTEHDFPNDPPAGTRWRDKDGVWWTFGTAQPGSWTRD